MTKRINRVLLLASITFFISACCDEDTYSYLKEKYHPSLHDTLCFLNNDSITKYVVIRSDSNIYLDYSNYDNCGTGHYSEVSAVYFKNINTNDTNLHFIGMSNSISILWNEVSYYDLYFSEIKHQDSLMILDTLYKDVYSLYSDNDSLWIWFNYKNGIIKYQDNNYEYWFLSR